MRVIILTSFKQGTAGHHLPKLISSGIDVAMVIYSEGMVKNKKRSFIRKIKKVYKIGILGALNGIRMRSWFNNRMEKYFEVSSIDSICEANKIPYYTTNSINSEETKKLFKIANADVALSLGNGYISKNIFSIPRYGTINIHHEILPDYQNAQSIIWQIYNGSSFTGYTIHKIESKIDAGDILFQERIPIRFKKNLQETIAYNSMLLLKASAEGLIKVLKDFEHYFKNAKTQGKGSSYTTPSFWQYLKIQKQHKNLKKNFNEHY